VLNLIEYTYIANKSVKMKDVYSYFLISAFDDSLLSS